MKYWKKTRYNFIDYGSWIFFKKKRKIKYTGKIHMTIPNNFWKREWVFRSEKNGKYISERISGKGKLGKCLKEGRKINV